ncbi:hypothetical protein GWI33_013995 [Rhynchophorus ferrugineus]|uniref:Uncharacterized protein n=1 Tax=Rhynchophorus ferrugineus TaxID=354439 RepID=A0A834I8A2_RHYFE|nr:hypothetical protein GWI33_013995 [Rhynchophorus ferrugineus]
MESVLATAAAFKEITPLFQQQSRIYLSVIDVHEQINNRRSKKPTTGRSRRQKPATEAATLCAADRVSLPGTKKKPRIRQLEGDKSRERNRMSIIRPVWTDRLLSRRMEACVRSGEEAAIVAGCCRLPLLRWKKKRAGTDKIDNSERGTAYRGCQSKHSWKFLRDLEAAASGVGVRLLEDAGN